MAQAVVAAAAAAVTAALPQLSLGHRLLSSLFSGKTQRFVSARPTASFPARGLRPVGPAPSDADEDDGSGGGSDGPGEGVKKSRNELKREARRAVMWGMELSKFAAPQIKRVLKSAFDSSQIFDWMDFVFFIFYGIFFLRRIASLEREVFDAIMLVKRLGPDVREGRRRQFSYIGRLLRKAQPELMDALIQASKDGDTSALLALSGNETWPTEDDGDEDDEDSHEETAANDTYDPVEASGNHVEIAARWLDGLVDKDSSITNEVYSIYNVEFDRQELRKLVRRVQAVKEADESGVDSDAKLTKAKRPLIRFLRSLAKNTLADFE